MFTSNVPIRCCALALLLSTSSLPALAQQVVLDRQVRAGSLTLFPSVSDDTEFFYAPTDARLARHEDGTPQFAFTRYIMPVSEEAEVEQADAAGVVTAVVELGVTEEQIEEARDAVTDAVPGATIVGPVTFTSGTFALISSFAEEGSETTDSVVGVGNMPLLEGDRAAVSLRLNRQGTLELWENFNRATPDVSFSFEADIDGYRAPKQALIEANFDRIYEHESFEAGLATPYLQAEIESAFDELRREGVISITQVGEDENMNAIIETAYQRLIDIIFEKAETTGVGSLSELSAAAGGGQSGTPMLDKASNLLKQQNDEAESANEDIRRRNAERTEAQAEAAQAERAVRTTESQRDDAQQSAVELRQRAQAARDGAAEAEADAERFDGEAAETARALAQRFTQQAERYEAMATEQDQVADQAEEQLAERQQADSQAQAEAEAKGEIEAEEEAVPIAIVAAYRMKRVRESGEYTIDLNKHTADTMSLRFDENIGNLTEFRDDEDVFHTVDLSDTAARQREVQVFLDGLNVDDFGQYVNFATVVLRKERGSEPPALQDIRIDRENFDAEGNDFRLRYVKLDDEATDSFLDYDYRVSWNFFGGDEVVGDWQSSDQAAIGITPPFQRRTIFLEADPDILDAEGVRGIEVRLYYEIGGNEYSRRLSLRPRDGEGVSEKIHFMQPAESYEYDYEVFWRMRDGTTHSTGRVSSEFGTVYLDEIPED